MIWIKINSSPSLNTRGTYYVLFTGISNDGSGELGTRFTDVYRIMALSLPATKTSHRLLTKSALQKSAGDVRGISIAIFPERNSIVWNLVTLGQDLDIGIRHEFEITDIELSHTQTRGTGEPCLLKCSVLLRAATSHSSF